jgi:indolepyruvate ferredoxin oxidoreductase
LIEDYRKLINDVLATLNQQNLSIAVELARAAGEMGGYGVVKDASVAAYETKLKLLLPSFETSSQPSQLHAA